MRRELAGEVGVLIFWKDDLEPLKRVENEILHYVAAYPRTYA